MKYFKTFEEQITVLMKRGLIINDYNYALNCLQRDNYYNIINAYKDLYVVNNRTIHERFIQGITFEEVFAIYTFDKNLRCLLLKEILEIEASIKTSFAYGFSYNNRDVDPLNPCLFYKKTKAEERINKINALLIKQSTDDEMVSHFKKEHEFIPLWVLVNVFTVGDTSILYDCMYDTDKRKIAQLISKNTGYKIEIKMLTYLLKNLGLLRNKCAHNNRIYDFNTHSSLPFNKDILSKIKANLATHSSDLFSMIVAIKLLAQPSNFNAFFLSLDNSMKELNCILKALPAEKIYKRMGLDRDWRNILI